MGFLSYTWFSSLDWNWIMNIPICVNDFEKRKKPNRGLIGVSVIALYS